MKPYRFIMNKFIKISCAVALCIALFATAIHAHSGGTGGSGGHYDHSTGDYHYHHGYSAHDHYDIDGDGKKDCPYEFDYDSLNKSETNEEETKNTAKKKITFGKVFGDIFLCFVISLLSFPLVAILLGLTALLPKKISDFLEEYVAHVYIISFVLTWLVCTIGYFAFNY